MNQTSNDKEHPSTVDVHQANDSPWTTDAAVNDFLDVLELPPADILKQYMAERAAIEAAAPREGEVAPDFRLEKLAPNGERSRDFLSPRNFRGRPLALLFGNYTCPIYRGQLEHFIAAHAKHGEHVGFLMVYIKEEHPEDGWQLSINHDQCVVYPQPRDADARAAVAADFVQRYEIAMPVVLDDMDNTVCTLYSAAPERLYVLDEDGVVAHRSPPGPFHMDAVEAWCAALEKI